jgi:hypothetical protein
MAFVIFQRAEDALTILKKTKDTPMILKNSPLTIKHALEPSEYI